MKTKFNKKKAVIWGTVVYLIDSVVSNFLWQNSIVAGIYKKLFRTLYHEANGSLWRDRQLGYDEYDIWCFSDWLFYISLSYDLSKPSRKIRLEKRSDFRHNPWDYQSYP